MSEKQLTIMGWIGTALSVIMYISYVPQIMGNIHGHKTFFLQPLAAAVNCSIWTAYGLLKEKRDYPLSAANFPGVVFGLIATITAF
jgi:integral membrane protein